MSNQHPNPESKSAQEISSQASNQRESKPRLNTSDDPMDLVRMQTEYAFFESMLQSKTLVIMFIVAAILFGGFFLFLYKMAGAG